MFADHHQQRMNLAQLNRKSFVPVDFDLRSIDETSVLTNDDDNEL